jgi:imidazolonepropionase-like amidohydrolase
MVRSMRGNLGARVWIAHCLPLLASVAVWLGCAPPKALPAPIVPKPPQLPWAADAAPVPEVSSSAVALVGATLMTGTGVELRDGVLTFQNGRIVAVGSRSAVAIPEGAEVIDVAGHFVTPGLIDAHSHMGVYPVPEVAAHADGNEATRPVTANVRAEDGFWPQDPALSHALASGVTSALVLPGSANLVGGQGLTIKLHPGLSAADMKFPGAPATLKLACGENPKRVYGERRAFPSTRMGNVAGFREAFESAREYGEKFTDWQRRHEAWQRKHPPGAEPSDPAPIMPDRDFGLETLVGALQGRVLLEIHCYRADDMLAMLALADEFGLQVRAFHHAVEAYKIRDVLAARHVAVATWADWWGFKLEAYDTVRENLALLSEAGVRGVVHSDSSSLIQRLNQEAAKSASAGKRAGIDIDRGTALAWITLNPAWVLGVDDQTGSLEPGKMADVVVWSGDPFSVYSVVDSVYVDGERLYDRAGVGRRPSDFELGQGAELQSRQPTKRPPPKPATPAAPASDSSGAAPGPGGNPSPGGVAPSMPAPPPSAPAPAAPAPASPAPSGAGTPGPTTAPTTPASAPSGGAPEAP